MPTTLTDSQLAALKMLNSLDHPTLREWADGLDVSITAVQYHRAILDKYGLITSTPGRSRSIKVTISGKSYITKAGQ